MDNQKGDPSLYIHIYLNSKAFALIWYRALTWCSSPARPFAALDVPLLVTRQQGSPPPPPACRQLSRARHACAGGSRELKHGTKLGPTLCYIHAYFTSLPWRRQTRAFQRNRLAWPHRRRGLASDGVWYADARSSVGRRFRSVTKLRLECGYGGVFLLLQQRSKHPQKMVVTPKASTSRFSLYIDIYRYRFMHISTLCHGVADSVGAHEEQKGDPSLYTSIHACVKG